MSTTTCAVDRPRASSRLDTITRAFTDRDWRPNSANPDALFADLIPIAATVDRAVQWRMECRHVDVYGRARTDAWVAEQRPDLSDDELAEIARRGLTPYQRWLELHQTGYGRSGGSAADRMCVLRHLVRNAS